MRTAARTRTAAPRRSLPDGLRGLFWEHSFHRLRWDRDREFILRRLLSEGGWSHVRLARRRFGDPTIREWIVRRKGRGLAPDRLRFWQLILDLPSDPVDAWVRKARRSSWGARSRR